MGSPYFKSYCESVLTDLDPKDLSELVADLERRFTLALRANANTEGVEK